MSKPPEEWTMEDYDQAAYEYSLLEREREKREMDRMGLEYLQQLVRIRATELGRQDLLDRLACANQTQLEQWLNEIGLPNSKSTLH
jgi:hypothetical protein